MRTTDIARLALVLAVVALILGIVSVTGASAQDVCSENPDASWCTGPSEVECPDGFEFTGDPENPCHETKPGEDPVHPWTHESIISYCHENGDLWVDVAVSPGVYRFEHSGGWSVDFVGEKPRLNGSIHHVGSNFPENTDFRIWRIDEVESLVFDVFIEPCLAVVVDPPTDEVPTDEVLTDEPDDVEVIPAVTVDRERPEAVPVAVVPAAETLPVTGVGEVILLSVFGLLVLGSGVGFLLSTRSHPVPGDDDDA